MLQVRKQMALQMSIEDFEARRDDLKAQLAAQYGIPLQLVQLEQTAGSLQLVFTIAHGGTELKAEDVVAALGAVDDSALATALGVPINTTEPTQIKLIETKDCPKGFWWCARHRSNSAPQHRHSRC